MEIFDYALIGLAVLTVIICIAILGALKDTSRGLAQMMDLFRDVRESIRESAENAPSGGGGSDPALLESIKKYDKHFSLIASTLSSFQTSADKGFKRVDQDLVRIESLVTGMRDYLAESNQQLTRLQEGYDYSVIKRVVKPVIQVANGLESLEPRLADLPEAEELRGLWLDLLDSLERNGVERLKVEQDDDFSDIRKMAEATTVKEMTDDPAKVGTVAEVVRPGYCYVYNYDKKRLLVPAQVKLYEKVEG